MNKLYRIIREKVVKFLREYDNNINWVYYEREDELKWEIMSDFLYNNNPDFTKHIPWKVIPFARLKKIWEDYMQFGFVKDERGLDMIEGIMLDNTRKINILTTLAGHTE